jgi:hypothetical protein
MSLLIGSYGYLAGGGVKTISGDPLLLWGEASDGRWPSGHPGVTCGCLSGVAIRLWPLAVAAGLQGKQVLK